MSVKRIKYFGTDVNILEVIKNDFQYLVKWYNDNNNNWETEIFWTEKEALNYFKKCVKTIQQIEKSWYK